MGSVKSAFVDQTPIGVTQVNANGIRVTATQSFGTPVARVRETVASQPVSAAGVATQTLQTARGQFGFVAGSPAGQQAPVVAQGTGPTIRYLSSSAATGALAPLTARGAGR